MTRASEKKTEGNPGGIPENSEAEEVGKSRRSQAAHLAGRIAGAAVTAAFLLYYCLHPSLYEGEEKLPLLNSGETYLVMGLSLLMIALSLTENHLSRRRNRILSWCWFAAGPFVVYFSLLYLNAEKFSIDFWKLNRIALFLTFVFLYLVQTLALLVTGSPRFSVLVPAILAAVLGIVNQFVISFRGMAISAADLFSVGTAMTVASEYTYKVTWHIFMEAFLTFGICLVSLKLKGGRMLHPAARAAVLAAWAAVAGSYYHVCCRTDFLEEHDIRSEGFTHQLRYKQYDMLFTTLCTCFYLSVDKPEDYSLARVQEIAAEYVDGGNSAPSAGGDGASAESVEGASGVGTDMGGSNVGNDFGVADLQKEAVGMDNESGNMDSLDGKEAQSSNATVSGTDGMGEASDADITAGNAAAKETESLGGESRSDKATGSAAANAAIDAGEQPNIIVIMNESFADYTDIGVGLDLSEDCMPFVHSLTEDTIKGNAYVSIFGGNTPNSEYEFLTGNTMAFLPTSSVGFNLFVRGNLPSVASELKEEGYHTLAIHPYRGTNYRRHIVYPQIGFDTYYTRDDFVNPHKIRSFISDAELAERIIQEYQENSGAGGGPLFGYNVTVQNHGGYSASNLTNLDMSIEVENPEVNREKTRIYVNLIRQSDAMFERLVTYFRQEEEPVVLLMFGDHQASLGDNTYEYLLGKAEEDCTQEERMEKYKVPFVIWANYDIPEETIEATSLNYLYSIMADRLNLPMTGYQEYLLDLSEEIPVICAQGYWSADGSYYEVDDESSPCFARINEYQILQYNDIFGKKNRYLEFFAETG